MMTWEQFFFWLFALLAVGTALMVISLRNTLSCAFSLILCFMNLAGLFVLLQAHFVAAAQILVYAGAIMVLFIFVIMLLNAGHEKWGFLDHRDSGQVIAVMVALLTVVGLIAAISQFPVSPAVASLPQDFGQIASVARVMFAQYLVAFELTSVLLLVAIIGAVLLAKRVI